MGNRTAGTVYAVCTLWALERQLNAWGVSERFLHGGDILAGSFER